MSMVIASSRVHLNPLDRPNAERYVAQVLPHAEKVVLHRDSFFYERRRKRFMEASEEAFKKTPFELGETYFPDEHSPRPLKVYLRGKGTIELYISTARLPNIHVLETTFAHRIRVKDRPEPKVTKVTSILRFNDQEYGAIMGASVTMQKQPVQT